MQTALASKKKGELFGDFVTMRADTLWLVVPQSHVMSADRLDDLPETEVVTEAAGIFSTPVHDAKAELRYYIALSEQMRRLGKLPDARYLVTKFVGNRAFWCWDEVNVMINAKLRCHPISNVIKTDTTPVHTLVTWGDGDNVQHAFLCESDDIIRFALDEVLQTKLADE